MGERKANKLIALAQEQIAEPVVAAAIVTPKGRHGAAVMGGLAGVAIHSASKSNTAFTGSSLFAMTNSALYAFRVGTNLGIKIKEPIGVWPWGSFGASTSRGKITQFLFLRWSDGNVHELEVHATGVNKFQGPFVDELVQRAAAASTYPPQSS
jgi:hypothetical protein